MHVEVHHYFHLDLAEVTDYFDSKFEALAKQIGKGFSMAKATLDDLQQKVNAETSVEQSAITLMQGLSEQLKAAQNDPAKIQALADQLDANQAALAAAVAANTPAADASAGSTDTGSGSSGDPNAPSQ